MLCSRPQTLVTAGRPQGGAGSQLQREEEGVVVLSRGYPPAVVGVHDQPPEASEAECLGAFCLPPASQGIFPAPIFLAGHLGQEHCVSFQGSLGTLKGHRECYASWGPLTPLKSRIQATGGERAQVVSQWDPGIQGGGEAQSLGLSAFDGWMDG